MLKRAVLCGSIFLLSLTIAPMTIKNTKINKAYAATQSCLPGIVKHRLNQIRRKWGAVRITSTYRHNAKIAGTNRPSFHATCQAVDFHPPRGTYWQVARFLRRVHNGGVGTYSCRHHHLHIDNGPNRRWHTCSR